MNFLKNEKGLTLIDLAIIMIVLGIIAVPLVQWYDADQELYRANFTRGQLAEVEYAIERFVRENDRYPRPASFTLAEGDAGHGVEYEVGVANPAFPAACPNLASGTNPDGVCTTAGAVPALIGAIPFASLRIEEDLSLDYWENKLTYVVSADQAEVGGLTYDRVSGGRIDMRFIDENRNLMPTTDTYDVLVLSMGQNGEGAYSKEGVLVQPCAFNISITPPPPGEDMEAENCDLDSMFLSEMELETGASRKFARSDISGSQDYYDDYTLAMVEIQDPEWFQNETDKNWTVTDSDAVGIGTSDPQARVHVEGELEAMGDVLAPRFCDENGNNCFLPEVISGTRTNSRCNTYGVIGLGKNRTYCGYLDNASGSVINSSRGRSFSLSNSSHVVFDHVSCPAGNIMTGFQIIGSKGVPICKLP